LPNPRQSISLFDSIFINNRGLVTPKLIAQADVDSFAAAIGIAIVGSLVLRFYARRQLFQKGKVLRIWPYIIGLLIGLPLIDCLLSGIPFAFEMPVLK